MSDTNTDTPVGNTNQGGGTPPVGGVTQTPPVVDTPAPKAPRFASFSFQGTNSLGEAELLVEADKRLDFTKTIMPAGTSIVYVNSDGTKPNGAANKFFGEKRGETVPTYKYVLRVQGLPQGDVQFTFTDEDGLTKTVSLIRN